MNLEVYDSHTAGEPTRVVTAGMPDLGVGTIADRARCFHEKYDHLRAGIVLEPRGSDALVGALLLPPSDPKAAAGIIFFNNIGLLGMCGHGTIGVVQTLAHMQRIEPGVHRLETPVGDVVATLHVDGQVSVQNVPSYRLTANVEVHVPDYGQVTGDVAWGGNWFFLVEKHHEELHIRNLERLIQVTNRIRSALNLQAIRSTGGHSIDHIELFAKAKLAQHHSRNFVSCPGGVYDRSPCGTGTSAKLACLAADGKLQEGAIWRQESIIGTVFESFYRWNADHSAVIPTITGRAWVTAKSTLIIDDSDPFRFGIDPRVVDQ